MTCFVYRKSLNCSKCPLEVLLLYLIYFHSETFTYSRGSKIKHTHSFHYVWHVLVFGICMHFITWNFFQWFFYGPPWDAKVTKWCLTTPRPFWQCHVRKPHHMHGEESQCSALFILCAAVSIIRWHTHTHKIYILTILVIFLRTSRTLNCIDLLWYFQTSPASSLGDVHETAWFPW